MARLWLVFLVMWHQALTITNAEPSQNEEKLSNIEMETSRSEDRGKSSDEVDDNSILESGAGPSLEELLDSYAGDNSYHVDKKKFNSWGGKRSDGFIRCVGCKDSEYTDILTGYEDNRVSPDDSLLRNKLNFHSWGGKRGVEDPSVPKRLPFKAWGGKRDDPSVPSRFDEYSPRIRERLGTRTGAYSSEKRSDDVFPDGGGLSGVRRTAKFNSWGGKRAFRSWGGKRSDGGGDEVPVDLASKYYVFRPWGGK